MLKNYIKIVLAYDSWVWGTSPPPLAAVLKQDYPDVEDAARYVPISFLLAAEGQRLTVSGALAGLLAIVIALLTVSFLSMKAALVNPVKSLRSE